MRPQIGANRFTGALREAKAFTRLQRRVPPGLRQGRRQCRHRGERRHQPNEVNRIDTKRAPNHERRPTFLLLAQQARNDKPAHDVEQRHCNVAEATDRPPDGVLLIQTR
jgi:hypothetical protein